MFSTYATIWFLPALWIGVSICYWLKRRCISGGGIAVAMVVLMIIGNLFGSYENLLGSCSLIASFNDWYMDVFLTWRNGIFNGAPYVFIGILLADGKGERFSKGFNIIATLVFCAAFLAEAYCISRFRFSLMTDMGFMMAPAIFFMMNTIIHLEIQQWSLWYHCRNLSMLIFLGQRLFLSALPGVIPGMKEWINGLPEFYIFVYFVAIVLAFSVAIEKLSAKYSFLKILW